MKLRNIVPLSAIALSIAALTGVRAQANTIDILPTAVSAGPAPYTWSYTGEIDADHYAVAGDSITVTGFQGTLDAASLTSNIGTWVVESNTVISPTDSNFTIELTSGEVDATTLGNSAPAFTFTASSPYNTYGSVATTGSDHVLGSNAVDNFTETQTGPAAVPEPAYYQLASLIAMGGLGSGLAFLKGRRQPKA